MIIVLSCWGLVTLPPLLSGCSEDRTVSCNTTVFADSKYFYSYFLLVTLGALIFRLLAIVGLQKEPAISYWTAFETSHKMHI